MSNRGGPWSERRSRPRRTWVQRAVISFNLLAIAAAVGSAAGLTYFKKQVEEIPRVAIQGGAAGGSSSDSGPKQPKNFLLVGVDDSQKLDPNDPVQIGRGATKNTDTIMILRVDPVIHKAYILSLQRDLWVKAPGGRYPSQRINESLVAGGPQRLIDTIYYNFQIPIDHYAEVDLAGFREIVNLLDGVPIYFPWPARDQHSGFFQYETGCVTLKGDQALAFVRGRYFETRNERGYWEMDPSSDFGRVRRQQEFVRAALRRAISKGARNPVTLNGLINSAKDAVVLDDKISVQELIDLAQEMRDFDPGELDVYQPPVRGKTTAAGGSVLELQEREAQPIFNIFRGHNPFADVRKLVRVEVLNGTGASGQGHDVGEKLAALGFSWTKSIDDSSFRNSKTRIRYATEGDKVGAVLLATYLDIDVPIEPGEMRTTDSNVALLVGSDFPGFRQDPRPLEQFAGYLPPGVLADDLAATATTAEVTTSSVPAKVPEPEKTAECS
ncbi:MAG: LCP family protein [Acidimicrobiales bacterium]|nr:LCP family protein [Acidimicrobiales bacterium]